MDLGAAGLTEQPFPTHGRPLAVVPYASHLAAQQVLRETCEKSNGLSLLQGPSLAGKSTTIETFVNTLPEHMAVAIVDGRGLDTAELLRSILHEFGYDVDLGSRNELLGLLRVVAMQLAVSRDVPLVIIDNVLDMQPGAIGSLAELAAIDVRSGSALKLVLVSDRPLAPMIAAAGLKVLRDRLLHDFHMQPMSKMEATTYLHTKLRKAGSDYPEYVFPDEICAALHAATGGWPGILDRVALLALARSDTLPVAVDSIEHPVLPTPTWDAAALEAAEDSEIIPPQPPQLVVTNNGSIMQELTFERTRLLIGRSDHNDIAIGSRFVSRHHALLVRHGAATFLMDLNSTNGTYVNAARVSNHVLKHEDVITIGHHRIKFYDPLAISRGKLDSVDFADTAIMKTLEDMRKLLARENTELMPAQSEDIPTLQT